MNNYIKITSDRLSKFLVTRERITERGLETAYDVSTLIYINPDGINALENEIERYTTLPDIPYVSDCNYAQLVATVTFRGNDLNVITDARPKFDLKVTAAYARDMYLDIRMLSNEEWKTIAEYAKKIVEDEFASAPKVWGL